MEVEMKIGVRKSNGTAVRYNESLSKTELTKLGIRPATEEEIREYERQKPLFDSHKINAIVLD